VAWAFSQSTPFSVLVRFPIRSIRCEDEAPLNFFYLFFPKATTNLSQKQFPVACLMAPNAVPYWTIVSTAGSWNDNRLGVRHAICSWVIVLYSYGESKIFAFSMSVHRFICNTCPARWIDDCKTVPFDLSWFEPVFWLHPHKKRFAVVNWLTSDFSQATW